MKFEVGDKVILISSRHGVYSSNPYWPDYKIEGTIDAISTNLSHKLPIHVEWNNRGNNHYSDDDLELVNTLIIDIDELFGDINI